MLELLTGLSKWSISVPCRLPAFVALRGFAERMLRSAVAGMLRAAPAVARIAHAHRLLFAFGVIAGTFHVTQPPFAVSHRRSSSDTSQTYRPVHAPRCARGRRFDCNPCSQTRSRRTVCRGGRH